MKTLHTDIVVCGGSLGGTLAAYSAAKSGKRVVLCEQTDWIGGQLTSQAVPPDEHKWIEKQGCTASYRHYRNTIRQYYRNLPGFSSSIKQRESFCPADSEVSYISHPPKLALSVLQQMLQPFVDSGLLQIELNAHLVQCKTSQDKLVSVTYKQGEETTEIFADMFLDGTDTGQLIALCEDFVTGAESRQQTGEQDAPEEAMPQDMQPVTYTACLENRLNGDFVIAKPQMYDYFCKLQAPYDVNKVFSMYGPESSTGKGKRFGMFLGETHNGEELFPLFKYRRIVCAENFTDGSQPFDVTLVNWPQNDFFLGNIYHCENAQENDELAKLMTLCFVYWLQTEAPRADGGKGYRWFRLATEYLGTADGLSKAPYIRESRRLKTQFTVTENHVTSKDGAIFPDSVGVGSYPIDLHLTTQTHTFFYKPTFPFTIPLGAFLGKKVKNLLPACKNIGTTHLTNGCYRLHPVEWNVGEVAGFLAAFVLQEKTSPQEVRDDSVLWQRFCQLLHQNGIQRYWQW